jgi:hypothetical protein
MQKLFIKFQFLILSLFIYINASQPQYSLLYEEELSHPMIQSLSELEKAKDSQRNKVFRISLALANQAIIPEFFKVIENPDFQNKFRANQFAFYLNNPAILDYFYEHDIFLKRRIDNNEEISNGIKEVIDSFKKIEQEDLPKSKQNLDPFLLLYNDILHNEMPKKYEIPAEWDQQKLKIKYWDRPINTANLSQKGRNKIVKDLIPTSLKEFQKALQEVITKEQQMQKEKLKKEIANKER